MDSKEPRQSNTKILIDIKTALKKSLEAWDPLLNNIESGLIKKDWEIISNMGKLVDGSLKKIEQILQTTTETNLTKEIPTCDHCHEPVFNSVLCSICHSAICNNCIDWACMAKTDTQSMICKKCSQLFENCKEDK